MIPAFAISCHRTALPRYPDRCLLHPLLVSICQIASQTLILLNFLGAKSGLKGDGRKSRSEAKCRCGSSHCGAVCYYPWLAFRAFLTNLSLMILSPYTRLSRRWISGGAVSFCFQKTSHTTDFTAGGMKILPVHIYSVTARTRLNKMDCGLTFSRYQFTSFYWKCACCCGILLPVRNWFWNSNDFGIANETSK